LFWGHLRLERKQDYVMNRHDGLDGVEVTDI
jgi:hypothetical protein